MSKTHFSKKHLLFLSLVLIALSPLLKADMGPKPTMTFEIIYEVSPEPEILSVTLLQCDDPDCSDAAPLEEMGPQGIRCTTNTECDALAYGFADYSRLVLEFDNDTSYTSNVFEMSHFNSRYEVTVTEDGMAVDEVGGSANSFVVAFYVIIGIGCCLGILVIVGIVLLIRWIIRRQKKKKEEAIV